MYRVFINFIGVFLFFISLMAKADLTTNVGITFVGADLQVNNLVAIELDKDIKNGVCDRNNVVFLDPTNPAQESLIAVAMIAKINGTKVVVKDDGLCGEIFNGSSVSRVVLLKG